MNTKILKMKKVIYLVGILLLFLVPNSSFAQEEGWSYWEQSDCLTNLQYRVKRLEYNNYVKKYKWSIEFKNDYRTNLHFNCKAVHPDKQAEIKASKKTSDRVHVKANGGTKKYWFLVDAHSDIYVYVNRIRLNDKDWGVDYYQCDK